MENGLPLRETNVNRLGHAALSVQYACLEAATTVSRLWSSTLEYEEALGTYCDMYMAWAPPASTMAMRCLTKWFNGITQRAPPSAFDRLLKYAVQQCCNTRAFIRFSKLT